MKREGNKKAPPTPVRLSTHRGRRCLTPISLLFRMVHGPLSPPLMSSTSKRPAPVPESGAAASSAKDAAAGADGGGSEKPGAGVPTSAEALLRLVKLMQGSVLYNLGCCCCATAASGRLGSSRRRWQISRGSTSRERTLSNGASRMRRFCRSTRR